MKADDLDCTLPVWAMHCLGWWAPLVWHSAEGDLGLIWFLIRILHVLETYFKKKGPLSIPLWSRHWNFLCSSFASKKCHALGFLLRCMLLHFLTILFINPLSPTPSSNIQKIKAWPSPCIIYFFSKIIFMISNILYPSANGFLWGHILMGSSQQMTWSE